MKLCFAFVMFFCLGVSANSYSQKEKVTLNLNNVGIKIVFKQIKSQTGLNFVYNADQLKSFKDLDVKVKNETVNNVLKGIFSKTQFTYKFEGNVIIIIQDESKTEITDKKTIKGKVVDEKGVPMPGVAVQVQGTNVGVATDVKGKYTIKAKSSDVLRFSFVGYKTEIVMIEKQVTIDVKLFPKTESLGEVSVVAFGEQKKESVVSSITSVKSGALKSSSSDLTSTFAGKIAGLIGWQTGGAPGALTEEDMNTKFYIRGITSYQTDANIDPLILLDGIEVSKLDLARIDPDDIESFNVMKDASATAMYGARGANGVIYVKTKKGKAGNVYSSFRYEKIWSMPTKEIDVVSPVEYMEMYNQALIGRNPNALPRYSAETIKRTSSSRFPDYVYPATDWYDKLFKDKVVNQHYALNVRGGTNKIQYYASATYNDDEGMLKTDKLNQFDCNIENKQITFRINLNVNLNKTAKLSLHSFSTYDKYHGSVADTKEAYFMAFRSNPVDFAPTYPADEMHDWPHILFGGNQTSFNPYAEIHEGYTNKKRYSSINKFEYIQSLSRVLKGLEVRATVAMTKAGYFSREYTNIPAIYSLASYDQTTNKHVLIPLNEQKARRTLVMDPYTNKSVSVTSMEYKLTALHAASWGNHQTGLTVVATSQERDNSTPQNMQNSLPQRNLGYAVRGTYGYKSRYFIEASCGYNGSERFSKENKMGFFPAFGAAWIASKENFMRSTSDWLSFLKFRLSYGKVGNDGVIRNPRFVYLQNIRPANGVSMGQLKMPTSSYEIDNYGNDETTWEISEQSNFGTEMRLFKGMLDINLDIYREVRHNIYSYRTTLPTTMGLFIPPLDNIGKVEASGFDFSGKIQHAFNSDFWFILNGTFTYNKAKYKVVEEASGKQPWQRKVGKEISQSFGYIADGLFKDQAEIDNAPYQSGDVQPGDIRYKDIDGNGVVDINDAVSIGYPETPRMVYGFGGFLHYKGVEFNIAFQGTGDRSFWIDPKKVSPFSEDRALLRAIAEDHWTPENQKDKPLWPRLSTRNIVEHNPQEDYYGGVDIEKKKSTYFMRSGKFLRCKSIEFAYYLNKSWTKKLNLKNCKIYCRANNPFIISDFKLWDVELGGNGFNYPIQKTYTLGVNVSF